MTRLDARAAALSELLARPDPDDLPARAHHPAIPGKPDRPDWLRYQPMIYRTLRLVDRENERQI